MQEPVSKYCKGKMLESLTSLKVGTVGDLMALEDNVKVRGLEALKVKVRELLNIPISIVSHSWYNLQCHTLAGGKLYRVTMKEVLLFPNKVLIRVEHRNNHFPGSMTPQKILHIHMLWMLCQVISDDEEDEGPEDDLFNILPPLEIRELSSACLPLLGLLKHNLCETNQFHAMTPADL